MYKHCLPNFKIHKMCIYLFNLLYFSVNQAKNRLPSINMLNDTYVMLFKLTIIVYYQCMWPQGTQTQSSSIEQDTPQ